MKKKRKGPTAFVLSGGASLGALETGMLKAIVEQGHRADLVLGSSVGSLNGAMYASDPTIEGVKHMEDIWRHIGTWDVFSPNPVEPLKNLLTFGDHLISTKNLRNLIEKNIPIKFIEATQIPLYITATDITTGDGVVFNRGLMTEALLCSAAIPAVFPSMHMGHRILVDGGLVNNSPIATAVKLGAKKVVVFPIGFPHTPEEAPNGIGETLVRSFVYMLNRQLSADYHIYKDQAEILIIPPPDNITIGPHDFTQSDKLIDMGYNRTKQWLDNNGYDLMRDDYMHPCDVHSGEVVLIESVVPSKGKGPKERVQKNIALTRDQVKESIHARNVQIKEKIAETQEEFKEKLEESAAEIKFKFSEKITEIDGAFDSQKKKLKSARDEHKKSHNSDS